MIDYGAKYTDEQLKQLENNLNKIYSEAADDIQKKMDDFNEKYAKKEIKMQKKLADKEITQDQFDAWKKGQVFQGKQWQAKKQQIMNVLYHTNSKAVSVLNGQIYGVFAENSNYMAYTLEESAGVNFGFNIYDQKAIENLAMNEPELLPPPQKVNKVKDMTWNSKKISGQVAQGIIQGESLDKIAKRLATVTTSQNMNSMKTHARTAMTGAQNAGRVERLKSANSLGINVQKEWMATFDGHTRISHRELDGQKVDTNKPFEIDGETIRYPGDPEAPAYLVYNCRCTLVGDIEDYPSTYNRYDNIDGKPVKGMTYGEWKKAKEAGEDLSPIPLTFKQFKTEEQQQILDVFGSMSMSKVFNEIKTVDSKTANQFYKTLGENGVKPSEAWKQYVNGNLSPGSTKKIDEILKDYAQKTGKIKEPVNLSEMFTGKKVSNVCNEIKEVDSKLANQFYKGLQGMDPDNKASKVWNNYLAGKLSPEETKKVESYLEKYLKAADGKIIKTAAITPKEALEAVAKKEADTAINIADMKSKLSSNYFQMLDDIEDEYGKEACEIIKSAAKSKTSTHYQKWLAGEIIDTDLDDALAKIQLNKSLSGAYVKKQIKDTEENIVEKALKTGVIDYDKFGDKDAFLTLAKYKDIPDLAAHGTTEELAHLLDQFKGKTDQLSKNLFDSAKEVKQASAQFAQDLEKAEKAKELKKAQENLVTLEDQIKKVNADKLFKGIWKEPVSYADYEEKKGKIAAKKKYYEEQIEKYQGDAYKKISWVPDEIAKYEQYIKDLEEFESNGKAYSALLAERENLKKQIKAVMPTDSIYDVERKNKAVWAKSVKEADDVLRSETGKVWKNATRLEKEAAYDYTGSYHKFNEPLRGIEYGTNKYKGVGLADLNAGYMKNGEQLNALTDLIDKTELPQDQWFQRGVSFSGMDKFFDVDMDLLQNGTEEELQQALLGTSPIEYGFMSMGSSKGSGFGGNIIMNIFAPKGTHAIYVEPFSQYGAESHDHGWNGLKWDGEKKQVHFGTELETLLQQGSQFRITKVEKTGGRIYMDLELINQDHQQRWVP